MSQEAVAEAAQVEIQQARQVQVAAVQATEVLVVLILTKTETLIQAVVQVQVEM